LISGEIFRPAKRRQPILHIGNALFIQGVLTNALNPKVAVFFLALLPQFIDTDAPSKVAAFVTLGLLFDATGTVWNLGVAWFAGDTWGLE
jgi:threonine/homoserine/homoserine lactone efflux protein